ncbi:MAG: GNAT family N-acetyltransferase [Chloroflexi bacterium]|nr:MAG: GNAT family N-acetyltransferase [Chloroflexota bacterium]
MVILETERLYLRHFTLDDVEHLLPIFSDPEVMRFYPATKDRTATEGWIRWSLDSYQQHGIGLWAVILKQGQVFLGDCGLTIQAIEGRAEVEIGYHIRRDHWSQGFATEAARACRDYAFKAVDVPRVVSLVRPDNVASRRVAAKIHSHLREVFWEKVGFAVCMYWTERANVVAQR